MADFTQDQLKSALVEALRQYGAAADATLVNLSKGIQKSGANAGGTSPGGGGSDPANDLKTRAATIDKGLKAAGDVLQNAGNMVSDSFANTTPTIGAFTSKFAGANGVIGAFSGVLDSNVQVFRTLSQSGLDLGNSLFSAQLAAAEAKIPLEVFSGVVRQNSVVMSAFGGTTTDGAVKFAKMTGKVMTDYGNKLGLLGFSMEEITSYNASYTEQMTRSGLAQRMTTAQLAEGAGKYNLELDRLAKATGVERQQLDEANKAQQRDVRMRLAMQNLSLEERTAITAKMEQLKKLDPTGEFAAGYQDLIASGGVATTKASGTLTLAMNRAGVDIQSITRGAFNGVKGSAEAIEGSIAKLGKSGDNLNEGQRRLTTTLATQGTITPDYMAATAAALKDTGGAYAKARDEQDKAAAEALKKGGTKSAAVADQALVQAQNSLKQSMIDSNIFPQAAAGLELLTDAAKTGAAAFKELGSDGKLVAILGASFAQEVAKFMAGNMGEVITTAGRQASKTTLTTEPAKPSGAAAAEKAAVAVTEKPGILTKIFKPINVIRVATATGIVAYHEELVKFIAPKLGFGSETPNASKVEVETPAPTSAPAPGADIPKSAVDAKVAKFEPIKVELDGTSVEKVNQSVKNISDSLKQIDFSKLMVPANISSSIETSNNKLKELNETLKNTTSSFNDLNNANLTKLTDTITKLNESVAKMSNQSGADSKTAPGTKVSAKTSEDILSELGVKLDQLNSTMASVASSQSDAVDYLSKTAKNTRQSVGNMLG